jgi:hypothetical protein
MIGRVFIRIVPWIATTTFVVWSVGQLVRDRSFLCGLMFYAPSPILAGVYSIAALVCWKLRSRQAWLYITLLLPQLFSIAIVENHWRVPANAANAGSVEPDQILTLVHWNLCRPVRRWSAQREIISSLHPDLIVLSEITDEIKDSDFPGYQVLRRKEMLIACRGTMTCSKSLIPGGALQCYLVECHLGYRSLRIMMADMTSNIGVWRDPFLRKLNEAMAEHQADILVGDLNSPRLSLALQDLPLGYRHAYDEAGAGWGYTWPVPAPCLAIDQCICGPKIHAVRYELRSTIQSDHRLQILEFAPVSKTQASEFSPAAVER